MSKWAICSKNEQFAHSLIVGERPELFADIAHFWWATWEICSHRSIQKREGGNLSVFLNLPKKRTINACSFIISDLSESLTVEHLSWATWAICSPLLNAHLAWAIWANRSQWLIWSERSEKMREWAMSKFPTLKTNFLSVVILYKFKLHDELGIQVVKKTFYCRMFKIKD